MRPPPETPELNRKAAIQNAAQEVGQFLDWLLYDKGWQFCQAHEHTGSCYSLDGSDGPEAAMSSPQCGYAKGEYYLVRYNMQELLAQYFELDLNKLDQEQRELLTWLRERDVEDEKNKTQTPHG